MKLNFGRRLILFIHWLASLLLLAIHIFPDYVRAALSFMDQVPANYVEIVNIVLLSFYLLLSLAVLCMVFKRDGKRADRGFITVDAADTGKVRIAITAIEQMVKQAVYTVDGIADMKISISNSDDAIAINVNVVMVNGSHVPTVTLNMQRAIRQYVEMNCGVAVRSVSINIQSVTANADSSGKRGKRLEAKAAAPSISNQEWSSQTAQPFVPATVEPEMQFEVSVDETVAEPVQNTMDSEYAATETDSLVDMNSDEAYTAVEELKFEEEKEN